MQIRTRLTLIFTLIVASIMFCFSAAAYYLSEQYRESEFYTRLRDKAYTTAHLLFEVKEINTDLLSILDRNNLTTLPREQITIFDSRNNIIYDSHDDPQNLPIENTLLNQIRVEREIKLEINNRQIVGVAYNFGKDRFVIISSAYDNYGLSKLRNLKIVLSIGLVVSLIFVMLAGWIYTGKIISPIKKMVAEVDKITVSNINARLNEDNGRDEFAQLAITFNKMLNRLQQAFEVQRSFVSNASHELRTPLTVITGQIEVAKIKTRSIEEYQEILASILDDIKSLNQLSNGLLDLAQVSLDIAHIKFKEIQLDELLYQAARMLLNKHENYNINFLFEEEEDINTADFTILGSDTLIRTAFINLMDNACKYSTDKQVQVTLGANSSSINIKFKDNGIGIQEKDLKKIFEPFYRSEEVKSIKGHGIGLSLTERIIDIHKGKLVVDSIPMKGTMFCISLPNK